MKHLQAFTMALRYISAIATLALAVHAIEPVCLTGKRAAGQWDNAWTRQVPDGRILSFCYDNGSGATIDQNWVNDIGAMLQTMVDGGGCCVGCLTDAAAAGCTGNSKIWNVDNCVVIGETPPKIDQYSKDVFVDLIQELADRGQVIPALDSGFGKWPVLTIDKVENAGNFREQEFSIFGDGDTC
jgi:hypothetical protein